MKDSIFRARFFPLVFLAFALAACASDGGDNPPAGPMSCNPLSASPGETVTCLVSGFKEDCTVFFGTSPVAATFEEAEGTITFIVPPSPPGSKQVSFQCGAEDPQMIDQNFAVAPAQVPDSNQPSPIIPTPPDTGTTPGPIVENPEPAPTVMPPMEIMFPSPLKKYQPLIAAVPGVSLEVVPKHEVKLGLLQLKWSLPATNTEGLKALYLYGPFDGDCTKNLVVGPSGTPLNPASANGEKYKDLSSGTQCEGPETCLNFNPSPETPTHCRIDLLGKPVNDLYLLMPFKEVQYTVVVQRADGTFAWDKVKAETKVTIDNMSVTIDGDNPTVYVEASYKNATDFMIIGCDPPKLDSLPSYTTANGNVVYTCHLRGDMNLTFVALGIDPSNNFKTETREVHCENHELALDATPIGEPQCVADYLYVEPYSKCYAKGELELVGTVTRQCKVIKGTTLLETKKVPWVKDLWIEARRANGTLCEKSEIKTISNWQALPEGVTKLSDQLTFETKLLWTSYCDRYQLWIIDLDGNFHDLLISKPLESPPPPVVAGLKVITQEGWKHDTIWGGGNTYIKFCPTPNFEDENCLSEKLLREPAGFGSIIITNGLAGKIFSGFSSVTLDKVQYFRIRVESNDGFSPSWLLTGLRVEYMNIEKKWRPLYVNPCVNRWLYPDKPWDHAVFGPKDTAVCLNLKTGTEEKSGTDDPISLVFPQKPGPLGENTQDELGSQSSSSPFFEKTSTEFQLKLDWNDSYDPEEDNYDDTEKGDLTSYGAYFFDGDPIERRFWIQKDPDGENGGWLLDSYELWVYHPGAPSFLYYWDCHHIAESPQAWIEDESSLRYPSLLGAADPTKEITSKQASDECAKLFEVRLDEGKGSVGGFL